MLAIEAILAEQGKLDVVVHNAGHLVSAERGIHPRGIVRVIDVDTLGAQRVNAPCSGARTPRPR